MLFKIEQHKLQSTLYTGQEIENKMVYIYFVFFDIFNKKLTIYSLILFVFLFFEEKTR